MFLELHTSNSASSDINYVRAQYDLPPISLTPDEKENFNAVLSIINVGTDDVNEEIYVCEEIYEDFIVEEEVEYFDDKSDVKKYEAVANGSSSDDDDNAVTSTDSDFESKKKLSKEAVENFYKFKCHLCDEDVEEPFIEMQQIMDHCSVSHNALPDIECICGKKKFSTWKMIEKHRMKHVKDDKIFYCYKCNKSFRTLLTFGTHMEKNVCKNKLICSTCGKNFKSSSTLKCHERSHLPDDERLKYPCTYCERRFANAHVLKIHTARIHEKTTFFTCEFCGKGFTTKSDLAGHITKHTNVRNIPCDICGERFKSKHCLRIHKQRHGAELNLPCPICKKVFRSSIALQMHKSVHGDKKYKCHICPKSFKRLENLKSHLSKHTGIR